MKYYDGVRPINARLIGTDRIQSRTKTGDALNLN